VVVAELADVKRALQQCAEILDRDGGRYRHVRRFKITPPYQS